MDPATGKGVEFLLGLIKSEADYLTHYEALLQTTITEAQKLEGLIKCVQHTVEEALRKGREIEDTVQNWFERAVKTAAEAKELIDSEDHKKGEHLYHLRTRRRLSKDMHEMIPNILKVLKDGEFQRTSYDVPSRVTVSPSSRGYVALDSRTAILNEIMMALNNPEFFIIGVYGQGGVGKTKLMEELACKTETNPSFNLSLDAVVMVSITDSPNVENIQTQIADSLRMKFDAETTGGRAKELRDRIKKKKSILVILDGISRGINLLEVGIPCGDDHKGCKLVLISTDLNMNACNFFPQKVFRLDVLNEDESWILFEERAGDVVQDSDIKPIAEKVAKFCAGLPLLIDHVANCLKKKANPNSQYVKSVWQGVLNQLEKFNPKGLHEKVMLTVELRYNWLETEELKDLFLFIGSFGLDYLNTGPLFICSWGLGLFTDCHSLADARVRFSTLINDLKASSLLLESEMERVRIHDLTRAAAKLIASRTRPTFGVKRYTEMKEWPKMEEPEKLVQIILPWSYIYKLPEKLECPELKLLQLQNIGDCLKVPDDFFSAMIELKVISLYGMMCTPSLPPSLCLLKKLQTLVLSGCLLEDISILAKLKSLEILRLERSDIKELPKEIGQLTNLRMLNLTNCSALRFIPANLISSLTCLEELYMGNCFIQWDVKGSNNASLEELRNLSHLTALDIMIQDALAWPSDLHVFEKLKRYNIFVGDIWKWSLMWSGNDSEPSRILKLEDNQRPSFLLDCGIKSLLNSAEDMCLSKIHGVENVLYKLNKEGFPQLKHLNIQDSTKLQYIINSNEVDPALPKLETLALQNLSNLEKICELPIPNKCFTKLRSFEVKGCKKLKNLLWCSLLEVLPQLRKIKVSYCPMITEIFVVETSEEDEEIIFPELRSLELDCLPELKNLCVPTRKHSMRFNSNALISVKVKMPHLELLKLSDIKSEKLWDDKPLGPSCIQNVKSLTIDKCDEVAHAFSSSVAQDLLNLKYLKISNCQKLEKIFDSDGNDQVIFQNLETLEISHMKLLNSVWHNQLAPKSFCKLKQMKIDSCKKLSTVFPSCVLDKLQELETVTVTDCPALEVVFETEADGGRQPRLDMQLKNLTLMHLPMLKQIWNGNPNESIKFQKICLLKVIKCETLKSVLPLSMAKKLQHLQEIYIEECGIESIIAAQDGMADTTQKLIFPKLTSLSFRDLTQLRSFYEGSHTLDCNVLRHVDVLHCDKLILFKPKSLNDQETVPDETPPLLSIEKIVQNKGELILNSNDVTMLCNGQLNDELIYTVKALCLRCFHQSDEFPAGFLQKFINLIKLKVTCSFFTSIFTSGSECAGHSETTMKLRSLVLVELYNLEFICEEKSEVQSVIQNIETLDVHRCSKLKNIVPSSVLFENLEQLVVVNCGGLEYIMKSSTVANLPKLRKLCIDGCEKIEEIVATDDKNDDASELCFTKLGYLRLNNLPGLRSFCKGRHDFKFPLLRTLFVINCPMMKTFSNGKLNAPKLLEVRVTPQDDRWNGDLNTTIDKIALKRNSKDDCVRSQDLIEDSSS